MNLYVDADLEVEKKSNDEVLQVSHLRSSTHKEDDSDRCPEQHDDMQPDVKAPILRMFLTLEHT
jgi:hypothetical protein